MKIEHKQPQRLLNPASGFLEGYSHTLNPYAGCAFACSYCYVRQMPVALFRSEPWGSWVQVKERSAGLLTKEIQRAKKKGPVSIFMSSSTDPYQPAEFKEKLTRSFLQAMIEAKPDFLFVQTRSPLVTRDLDLLSAMKEQVMVSITIETDLEHVRKAFTPYAPPLQARWRALSRIREAGIPVQAAVAPLLPSSPQFAGKLAGHVARVCVDDFFMGDGRQGKRTEKLDIKQIHRKLGLEQWYDKQKHADFINELQLHFPGNQIFISKEGFMPPKLNL